MSSVVIVGTQWGDEGKGKIVDLLTRSADYVVRFQGGNNAGHTVEIGERTYCMVSYIASPDVTTPPGELM